MSDFLLRTLGWSLSVCQELSSVLPHRGFQTRVWWQAGHVGCLTHHLMISFTLAFRVKWELNPRSHQDVYQGHGDKELFNVQDIGQETERRGISKSFLLISVKLSTVHWGLRIKLCQPERKTGIHFACNPRLPGG